ncbi:glycosyltransferase [Allobacillus halotolerans]|uniref:Glycosyltransferase n=1 Tax=Allobacillus halotolerans TaxID=570278 RepID=A0ABS6GRR5_9BACI|nr:glycosyltransferase [Allobacillus halotolerans]MBU6081824.1 glycosyltransferase [Allobacillus halotolerans]
MELVHKIIFFMFGFIIFWGMVGYPFSLKVISHIYKNRKLVKDYNHQPTVTVMVVAHNEEKVILHKLKNLTELNYPKEKIEFLITSDNSSDSTNKIVNEFIEENKDINIRLYEVRERKGKTNAQNEAQKLVETEYLVMTDANSLLDKNSISELMAAFSSPDIAYVTGKLSIINTEVSDISSSESSYWNSDLAIREIEGNIQSITAGNGALYACRNKDYYNFDLIKSHDSAMPLHFVLKGRRAICNHDAIAYEKVGEEVGDEFGRKIRMNRRILEKIIPDIRLLNIFRYKWFSYFYFGHRTCRYLLWISHLLVFISNLMLVQHSIFYAITFTGQILFYLMALTKLVTKTDNKYLTLIYYYNVTIIAQWIGVYNIFTGKAKPFWEKAETTR